MLNRLQYICSTLLFVMLCLGMSPVAWGNANQAYEDALKAFAKEDYQSAYIFLKTSLQEEPDNLPSKILMGKVLLINGVYQEAETEFAEALFYEADINLFIDSWGDVLLKQNKFHEVINYTVPTELTAANRLIWLDKQAVAYFHVQEFQQAALIYNDMLKIDSLSIQALLGKANIALQQDKHSMAKALIVQASDIAPHNPQVWRMKGQIAKASGNLAKARDMLQHALTLAPTDSFITRDLADVYLAMNDLSAAKHIISDVLNASPNDPYALLADRWINQQRNEASSKQQLNDLSEQLGDLPDGLYMQQPNLIYLKGVSAFLQGNYEQARTDFHGFLTQVGQDVDVAVLLAKTQLVLGESENAMALLEPYEDELTTSNLEGALILGDLYLNQSKTFKAQPLVEELKVSFPQNTNVILFESKVLLARKKIKDAQELINRLKITYPNNPSVLLTYSTLSIFSGELDNALKSISTLLEIEPKNVEFLDLKAAVLTLQGNIPEAKLALQQVLAQQPNIFSARYNQANLLFKAKQYKQAEVLLVNLLDEMPKHVPSLLLYSQLLQLSQGSGTAIDLLKRVLIIDKNNTVAIKRLIKLYKSLRQYDDALYYANKLSKQDLTNPAYVIEKVGLYLATRDEAALTKELSKLAVLVADNASGLFSLAQLQVRANKNQDAAFTLQKAHKLAPSSLPIHLEWVRLLTVTGDFNAAETQILSLTKRYPDSPDVMFRQGEWLEYQHKLKPAFDVYLNIVNVDQGYDLALAKLFSLILKGLPQKPFVERLTEIVTTQPERYFPRSLLAQFHYYAHNDDLAIKHYETILAQETAPNEAALLARLAELYLPTNINKSQAYANRAYILAPQNINVLDMHGWVKYQHKDYNGALTLLRKAFSRNSNSANIRFHLASTLNALSQTSEAKSLLLPEFVNKLSQEDRKAANAILQKQ